MSPNDNFSSFLGMTTTAKAGGRVINYSHRFTVSKMTGSFTDDVQSALSGISGTAGPADVLLDDGASRLEIRQANVPFNEQVGPTRYAPMAQVPGTSITAKNTSPLFPTSSVVLAKTFLPIATVLTTAVVPITDVVASRANTVRTSRRFESNLCMCTLANLIYFPRLLLKLSHQMTWPSFSIVGKIRFTEC